MHPVRDRCRTRHQGHFRRCFDELRSTDTSTLASIEALLPRASMLLFGKKDHGVESVGPIYGADQQNRCITVSCSKRYGSEAAFTASFGRLAFLRDSGSHMPLNLPDTL